MPNLTLMHAVHTVDNTVLLPAGTTLTPAVLTEVVASSPGHSRTYSLLDFSSVKKDILEFISVAPYVNIFSNQAEIAEVFTVMDEVRLSAPLLESMEYFREKDFHTYRHILMVFALSTLVARDLIDDEEARLKLAATGPTHDIGKICVPLPILGKVTPLTRAERQVVQHHTMAGYVLLSYYLGDGDSFAAVVARDHHERRNGVGHPRGIRQSDLMIEIIAVCDVYDALISPRPYRPVSYDNRTALEEITRMAEDGEIGWEVVKALVAYNRKGRPSLKEGMISIKKRGTPPAGNVYGILADD